MTSNNESDVKMMEATVIENKYIVGKLNTSFEDLKKRFVSIIKES